MRSTCSSLGGGVATSASLCAALRGMRYIFFFVLARLPKKNMGQCLTLSARVDADVAAFPWMRKVPLLEIMFLRWCRVVADAKLETIQRKMRLADDRMAQLHQAMLDQEASLRAALRNEQKPMSEGEVQCAICYETVLYADSVECTDKRHACCLRCVERLAQAKLNDLTLCEHVSCPSVEECPGRIAVDALARCASGRRLINEWQHERSRCVFVDAISTSELTPSDALKMRYVRADGTFAALQCPSCGHGPIEHFRCDDLTEFHHTRGYSNACPVCKRTFSSVKEYALWQPAGPSRVRLGDPQRLE